MVNPTHNLNSPAFLPSPHPPPPFLVGAKVREHVDVSQVVLDDAGDGFGVEVRDADADAVEGAVQVLEDEVALLVVRDGGRRRRVKGRDRVRLRFR